ncbi:MAG: ribosome biogenesis GTPase Der [Planctomycetota bacterium]
MIPVIAIVGRPNVGKSSLLNAFAKRRIAIVDAMPGVTRDRVSHEVNLDGDRSVEFVDTGGIGIVDTQALESDVEHQVDIAIATADVILFVCDVREGPQPLDRRVAEILRKVNKPVILLANKADDRKFDAHANDFFRMGFETVLPISANSGRLVPEFFEHLETVLDELGPAEKREDPAMRLAIIGKRNSGKSTLVNRLADGDRVIVSEIEGTTRDSVDVRFRYKDREFVAIDTAGLRKQRSVENTIEYYSQHRALRSLRRADVVLLLMDCQQPATQIDKKTADAIMREGKPVIIGVNKWDLSGEVTPGEYTQYVRSSMPGLQFAPTAFLSGQTGSNVWQVISLAEDLFAQSTTRVGTGELNRVLGDILTRRPPMVSGRRAKFYFATQVGIAPPTLVMFVNDPELVNNEYRRYLVNRIHELLPFAEVPVKLVFRARKRGVEAGASDR